LINVDQIKLNMRGEVKEDGRSEVEMKAFWGGFRLVRDRPRTKHALPVRLLVPKALEVSEFFH
jgi:hypothetical protein